MSLEEELDFGDIEGATKKTSPTKTVHNDIIVIPVPEASGWINKSLLECTGKEFVKWAASVYPVDLSKNTQDFQTHKNRLIMFRKILAWHMKLPHWIGSNKKFTFTSVH